MTKYKHKSIIWILLSRLIGIIVFLIMVFVVNILAMSISNTLFNQTVNFLNSNIVLIIIISIIFLIGELFDALIFPFNLPAPLFNAVGSVFLVSFIFRVFMLVDLIIEENVFHVISGFSFFVYPLVFLVVLVSGYIAIFSRLAEAEKPKEKKTKGKLKHTKSKTWQEVGDEFRQTIYDFLALVRNSINKKKRKK